MSTCKCTGQQADVVWNDFHPAIKQIARLTPGTIVATNNSMMISARLTPGTIVATNNSMMISVSLHFGVDHERVSIDVIIPAN